MGITINNQWWVPFIGILICGGLLLGLHQWMFGLFLSSSQPVRIVISFLMIFPLGFFLGMPFPLGILAIRHQPKGSIAWAWGMNGLFTVVGGLTSVLLSIFLGFRVTIMIALIIYCLAWLLFGQFRKGAVSPIN